MTSCIISIIVVSALRSAQITHSHRRWRVVAAAEAKSKAAEAEAAAAEAAVVVGGFSEAVDAGGPANGWQGLPSAIAELRSQVVVATSGNERVLGLAE